LSRSKAARNGAGLAVAMLSGAGLIGGVAALSTASSADRCLGEFSTPLEGRTANQRHNALLAVQKIDGVVIRPSETFSFNGSVGSYSRDQGFRRAPVSYNGTLVKGWGGGVCQTSTTLYNAALLAGMPILERNRHRFAPSYCPPGRDAAVAFDTIDLKFKNDYDFPIRIRARFQGSSLTVGLYGKGEGRPVKVLTQVMGVHEAGTMQLSETSGRARVRNTGKLGFEVATIRTVGGRRERVSEDSYPPMSRVVEFYSEGD
jgi:vancomycin resistance protein VanW